MNEKRLPSNYVEFNGESIMSNFDHQIINETLDAIKENFLFSRYPGLNFNGLVWWQDDLWHCEVWQNQSYKQTFSSTELETIAEEVSSEFGSY